MSDTKFKVVITGATGGIGQEIVKLLGPMSSHIVLVGLFEDELSNLKTSLKLENAHVVSGNINEANVRQKVKKL
jgi:NADP-dependent 3-hydroxy acid dehydrogenase YdfG